MSYTYFMNAYEKFLEILEVGIEKYGNPTKLAEALNVQPNLITRWRKKERTPTITTIQPLLDLLGADIFMECPDLEKCRLRLKELESELEKTKQERDMYKYKWEGHLETVRAQGNPIIDDPFSQESLPFSRLEK